MLSALLKPFAGRHYRKFLEASRPIVAKVNEFEKSYQSLTDEQLRAKTEEFMGRVKTGETLDQILPEAFAAVKNAARRLVGRTIMVCEHELTWDMVHFDVQLIGGMALHQGKIAEMATGEGKTLVATLPLYLNALSGRNAQLVTVNDYLARRDSEWMGHLYGFLGVTVGCIQQQMAPALRREMYGRSITYGTASEFGFDYLRDNGMATRKEDQVQRDHYYCIVDEVDSILVDEARTPLIISGPAPIEREQPFTRLKPGVDRLVADQMRLCNRLAGEAREKLEKPDLKNEDRAEALAVAGFAIDDLVIELIENQLSVRGKQADDSDRVFLHRGIAARQFQRSFMLADGIEILGARLDNGLLAIDLVRPVAEPRMRTIRIDGSETEAGRTDNTVDITARRAQTR